MKFLRRMWNRYIKTPPKCFYCSGEMTSWRDGNWACWDCDLVPPGKYEYLK